MKKYLPGLFVSIVLTIVPVAIIWTVFILKPTTFWGIPLKQDGMATIVSNYDGPLYLAVAKTMYNPEGLKTFEFNLPVEYYAAHFPLYPYLIRAFSPLLGYPYSMLAITVLASFGAIYFFYLLAQSIDKEKAIFLTVIFAILPARFLIVRSVGSPEPLFLATIIASVYYFRKEKYLLSAIAGTMAVFTKSPGILLFVAYTLQIITTLVNDYIIHKKKDFTLKKLTSFTPLLLMPLGLIGVFAIYSQTLGNFWAYFNSGDNIHLFFPPFQIFNSSAPWVGTFWLEEIVFIYLLSFLGLFNLIEKKEQVMAFFTGIFLMSLLFVSHRDLMRYSLPIMPFIILSFKEFLVTTKFKIAFAIIFIPILLYSISFISQNSMPISNWAPLL